MGKGTRGFPLAEKRFAFAYAPADTLMVCDAISRSVLAATQRATRLPAPAGNSPPLQGEVSRKPLAVYETEGLGKDYLN